MRSKGVMSGQVAVIGIAVFAAFCMFGQQENQLQAATKKVKLTPTLVAWISSQSENIVEEMQAIVDQQVVTGKFSVVYYLRYLNLYESLKVVASKVDKVDKFRWIARKVAAFGKVNENIYNIVAVYLNDLDEQMAKIEADEKPGQQQQVGTKWVTLYETINYIRTHAPQTSKLAESAKTTLQKSPSGPDKVRSTRYMLYRSAFV